MQLRTNFQESFSNVFDAVPYGDSDAGTAYPSDATSRVTDFETTVEMVSLPVLATASDVREVVKFLKRKPLGVSITEMMNAEPRRIFDARKIAAYEFWGIIRHEDQRVRLSERGADLAEKLEPESQLYRTILHTVPAYLAAVNSIYSSNAEVVTHREIIQFWRASEMEFGFCHERVKDEEAAVVSFFSLCHAAEIGTATVGKRGQPARLRVDVDQMRDLLEMSSGQISTPRSPSYSLPRTVKADSQGIERVYISANTDGREVDQIRNVLCLADFESVAVAPPTCENGLLPISYVSAMQQCQAAVFVVDSRDAESEGGEIADLPISLLTEINVALALLGERVILFSNSDSKTLKGKNEFRLHILECQDFQWESCIRLAAMLKELRA